MKIAVLSGKGGTGKTLVSVNLAYTLGKANYIDCDVEEPNGFLFFDKDFNNQVKPEDIITAKIPRVDELKCDGCKKCVDFCKYNALAYTKRLMIFQEVCHSCGGCMLVCPQKAIDEIEKEVGKVRYSRFEDVNVFTGMMKIGEASGIPIIKRLLSLADDKDTIIDCPPGSACIVMESIQDADYCVLVAEPTKFGAHNLELVYKLTKLFDKKVGVVLNKCLEGENPSEDFCINNNIEIIGRIAFDKELGYLNSKGIIIAKEADKYKEVFEDILEKIRRDNDETVIGS